MLITLPFRAKLIVFCAFFFVREHLVSFVDFLKFFLRTRFLVYIRVILTRQVAISALNLIIRRSFTDTKRVVVIFVFHNSQSLKSMIVF